MADISQVNFPNDNNNPYDIADTTARSGLADKMDKVNPTGTGSFSLNRKANTTVGTNSFAEGSQTTASGSVSHTEGFQTTASGDVSHAEGAYTNASGDVSHAGGFGTTASGMYSHADGLYSTANHKSQHVFGEYNALDDSSAEATARGTYVEIVGNGTASDSRSNARTLDWSGNEVLSGTIEATGFGTTLDKEVDRGGVQLTQAQYDALVNAGTVDANTTYFITDANNTTASYAAGVTYDNASSGLTATNVQGAIDELASVKVEGGTVSARSSEPTKVMFANTYTQAPHVAISPYNTTTPRGYARTCCLTSITTTYFEFVEVAIKFDGSFIGGGNDRCEWVAFGV